MIAYFLASVMLLDVPFARVVMAEEVTATNRIQAGISKDENRQPLDIKARAEAILHPKKDIQLDTIPKNHAFIPKDTILTVELTESISSKKMKKGMPVPLKLKENLIVNDVIVVPAGTEVEGTVTNARKNGFFGRSGKLEFTISSVETINGVRSLSSML